MLELFSCLTNSLGQSLLTVGKINKLKHNTALRAVLFLWIGLVSIYLGVSELHLFW